MRTFQVSDPHRFADPEALDEWGGQRSLRKGTTPLLQGHPVNLPLHFPPETNPTIFKILVFLTHYKYKTWSEVPLN